MYCVTVLEVRSLCCRYQQGWFFLRATREKLFHFSFLTLAGLPGIFGILLARRSLSSSLDDVLYVHVCVHISSFVKDMSYIGVGAHPIPV